MHPFQLEDFVSFVLAGGEVMPAGLSGRVRRAHSLAFLRSGDRLIGVAGLKSIGSSLFLVRVEESRIISVLL